MSLSADEEPGCTNGANGNQRIKTTSSGARINHGDLKNISRTPKEIEEVAKFERLKLYSRDLFSGARRSSGNRRAFT
jgi:hypothetical protein